MGFLKDMFVFFGNMMVGLVIAVFVAAILMEGYDWAIGTWRFIFA